jgi:hypothetical protein
MKNTVTARWILVVIVLGTSCAGEHGQVGEDGVVGPSGQDSGLVDGDPDSGGAAADSGDAEFERKDRDVPADSADAEFDPKKGWVQNNTYKCCPQGEGTSCCLPDERLCFDYQPCVEEDDDFDPKTLCQACCKGLKQIAWQERGTSGACELGPAVAVFCTKCGDGVCAGRENPCNCPSDCGNP